MPLRSLILLLCCQNPKLEDDLDSLNNFIKTLRESVQGMRSSVNNFHASMAEFHKAMGTNENVKNNKDFTSQDSKVSSDKIFQQEESTEQPTEQSEDTMTIEG